MTAKKLVFLIGGIMVGFVVLVGVFVGAIILFALYSFGTSDAAVTAKDFLRSNQQLKQEIGDVEGFGTFVSGNVSISNGNGTATVGLKVIGQKHTVNATVELLYLSGRPWRVTSASYKNEAGRTVDLLNPYDSLLQIPSAYFLAA